MLIDGSPAAEAVTVQSRDKTPIARWQSGSGPSLLAVRGTAPHLLNRK